MIYLVIAAVVGFLWVIGFAKPCRCCYRGCRFNDSQLNGDDLGYHNDHPLE